jgi:hypothetical protein
MVILNWRRAFRSMRRALVLASVVCFAGQIGLGQTAHQPRVAPGANEPDWKAILAQRHGLSMFDDLLNPVVTTAEQTPGLFRKASTGPVTYVPIIALGLTTRNRGGWYVPSSADGAPRTTPLWSYVFKNTAADLNTGKNLPPPLEPGSKTTFDPGDEPFGLYVSNDELADGGVFTQPRIVARMNRRLSKQPYKAMIYPNRDKTSGKDIPNSYIIGWEYSTNDDFQDVVCRLDNVVLIANNPTREGRK